MPECRSGYGSIHTTAFGVRKPPDDLSELLGRLQPRTDWYESKQAVQAYIHGLERFAILEGYTVDMLTGTFPIRRADRTFLWT